MQLKEVIEALVFASQKPLLPKEMVAALRSAIDDSDEEIARALSKIKEPEVLAALEELRQDYEQANRAFQLVEQVTGWSVVTKPDYALWVRQLYPESKPTRLSGPALETLAIVAYRQPITKADIEAVRGVAVDGVMQSLLDRGLVRIAGRAEVPGRPLLYETTQVFMEHFGLRHLEELPNSDELRRVNLPKAPTPEPEPEKPEKPAKGKKGKAAAEGTAATPQEGSEAPLFPADQESKETSPASTEPADSDSAAESVEQSVEPAETSAPPSEESSEPAPIAEAAQSRDLPEAASAATEEPETPSTES